MTVPVVDVHTHWVPPAAVEAFKRREDPPRIYEREGELWLQYGERMQRLVEPTMVDLDAKLASMERSGVDFAVLTNNIPGVDWFAPEEAVEVARAANDEFAAAASAHPDRFAALATLPCQVPEAAAAELERAVSIGLKGAHVYSNVAGKPLDDPSLRVIFDAAAALGVPISLHPTYPLAIEAYDVHALVPVLGYLADSTGAALRLVLDGLFERHPDLRLYLAHVGSLIPFIAGRIDYESTRVGKTGALRVPPTEHLRRLYTDSICVWPPALRLAVEFFGPDHVMLGTDEPFWDPNLAFETLERAGFDEAVERSIRSATAAELFGLERVLA